MVKRVFVFALNLLSLNIVKAMECEPRNQLCSEIIEPKQPSDLPQEVINYKISLAQDTDNQDYFKICASDVEKINEHQHFAELLHGAYRMSLDDNALKSCINCTGFKSIEKFKEYLLCNKPSSAQQMSVKYSGNNFKNMLSILDEYRELKEENINGKENHNKILLLQRLFFVSFYIYTVQLYK